MDGRALPGYYYDAEKKKYFKILPSHAAPPDSKYSKESIQREKRETRNRKRKELHNETVKRERVLRQSFQNTLLCSGLSLSQEFGHHCSSTSREDSRARAYFQGLKKHPRRLAGSLENSNTTSIPAFVFDNATGGILWAQYYGGEDVSRVIATGRAASGDTTQVADSICIHGGTDGKITSASLASQRAVLFTSQSKISIEILYLNPVSTIPTEPGTYEPPDVNYYMTCATKEYSSCWTGKANPFSDEVEFVVGLSSHAVVLAPNHGILFKQELPTDTDVFATEWLQPGVSVLGQRNGLVTLWDHRAKGSAARLLHPSCITALCRVDENKILVAGLEDALCLYDLRMSQTQKTPPRRGVPGKRLRPDKANQPNTPLLRYDHSNEFLNPLGLDLCAELGLVAAGTDDGKIRFHALNSGELIGERENTWGASRELHQALSLQFVAEDQGVRLLSTCGSQIVEYAW